MSNPGSAPASNTEPETPGRDAKVLFTDLVFLFEKLTSLRDKVQKKKLLTKWWAHYSDPERTFAVMRLILPELDKDRQSYGMKEMVLTREYIAALGIAPRSDDAQMLQHFQNPTMMRDDPEAKAVCGDYSGVLEYILRKRAWSGAPKLTIADVNTALDNLYKASSSEERRIVLQYLINNATPKEHRWISRIILKVMKLGCRHEFVLRHYHKQGADLYNICSSLRRVCWELRDPRTVIPPQQIELFQPVKPMLADRAKNVVSIPAIMKNQPFSAEIKYDGERIQIHKDAAGRVEFFTRNSNSHTHHYGAKFGPIIRSNVKAETCILDGELVVWNTRENCFEPFGNLKTVANDSSAGGVRGRDADSQLLYIAFDVLMINGRNLMGETYKVRREALEGIIIPKEKELELCRQTILETKEELNQFLDDAISRRDEGIMIKDINYKYVPNERARHWLKLKPDYIDGYGESLDLIVMGGYWADGMRRAGGVSAFLLGVISPKQPGDKIDSSTSIEVWTVGKVGTGYSLDELAALRSKFEGRWKKDKPRGYRVGKEIPNLWIAPEESVILQVKFGQFALADKFATDYTLRFPRVMRIRYDKPWHDCMTLHEYQQECQKDLRGAFFRNSKTSQDRDTAEPISPSKARAKRRRVDANAVLDQFKFSPYTPATAQDGTDNGTKPNAGTHFKYREFCLLNGSAQEKTELQELIVLGGGTLVANVLPSTNYVVAAEAKGIPFETSRHADRDVMSLEWVRDSARAKQVLDIAPKYMLNRSAATQKHFGQEMDRFSLPYKRAINVDDLKNACRQVAKTETLTQVSVPDILEQHELRTKLGLFSRFVIYLDVPAGSEPSHALRGARSLLLFYGAKVSKHLSIDVTHVIFDEGDLSRLDETRRTLSQQRLEGRRINAYLVLSPWVAKCVRDANELQLGHSYGEDQFAPPRASAPVSR